MRGFRQRLTEQMTARPAFRDREVTGAQAHLTPAASVRPDLLACPFCRRADRLQRVITIIERPNGTREQSAEVECLRCEATEPEAEWQDRPSSRATADTRQPVTAGTPPAA